MKVDEKNCFGLLEWPAVRQASFQSLPRHYPFACWEHVAVSSVEQRCVDAKPKGRGAEQGGCRRSAGVFPYNRRGGIRNAAGVAQCLGSGPFALDD